MTTASVLAAAKILKDFMSPSQLNIVASNTRGEEGEFFKTKMVEMANLIRNMPKTYEQDGKGNDAIVSLHYFHGGFDWYITEKDMGDGTADSAQWQAYGYADMGYPEMGYICIAELIANGVELDLHFEPRTLAEVKKERGEL